MKLQDIGLILLFIIPGVIANNIDSLVNRVNFEKESGFKELISGISMSLPIIIASGLIYYTIEDINTIEDFISNMNYIKHVLVFGILVLLFSVILGFIIEPLENLSIRLVNFIRSRKEKDSISYDSAWEYFIKAADDYKFVEVIQDGQSYKGFLGPNSIDDDKISLVLEIDETLHEYDDFDIDAIFTDVKGIYINNEKRIVIRDYNTSEYKEWCDKQK